MQKFFKFFGVKGWRKRRRVQTPKISTWLRRCLFQCHFFIFYFTNPYLHYMYIQQNNLKEKDARKFSNLVQKIYSQTSIQNQWEFKDLKLRMFSKMYLSKNGQIKIIKVRYIENLFINPFLFHHIFTIFFHI